MLSRRDLVGKLAAGAAGAVVLAASSRRVTAAVATGSAHGPSERNDDYAPGETPAAAEAVQEGALETVGEAPSPPAPPPWELLRPLALGSVVAHGWRLTDLSGPADGACVLTLQNERGRVQRVHLCRNDGRPQGLVYTKRFDLVVMNGGQGDLGTEENLAQAVAAISHVLAGNEDSENHAVVTALLPHAERLQQFSEANEWTLR